MSEKFRLDRKIGFQNTFYTKCINVVIDSIGPSIILRSILQCIIIDKQSNKKPVFGVSDKAILKSVSSATETTARNLKFHLWQV